MEYGNWLNVVSYLSNENRLNTKLINEIGMNKGIAYFYEVAEQREALPDLDIDAWDAIRDFITRNPVEPEKHRT